MKKGALIGWVFLLSLGFVLSEAQAGPLVNPGSYSTTNGDFTTKFWKEKFIGGGPGQPGNVLMAIGQGFVFQHGTLEEVASSTDPNYDWMTTYRGGTLILNSQGPWLEKGILIAKDITAVNYSKVVDGQLQFYLTMEGSFQNAPYTFSAEVMFEGGPDTYWIKYDENGAFEFQGGTGFEVNITISPR